MRISVITPCYNAAPYLSQAIRSAVDQTHAPHEIIVIDDGSSDDSVTIVESLRDTLAGSGLTLTLLHSQRAGGAGARNVGARQASGDCIAFLDADDYWLPHHLANAVGMLSQCDDVAYTALDDYLYEDGRLVRAVNPWSIAEATSGLTHEQYIACWHQAFKFAMNPTVVRLDRFLEVGGFDEDQWRRHDFEMFLRVIHDRTWSYNPVADAVYRADTPGSISREKWASSEYYGMKALHKNAARYAGAGLEPILQASASRTLASAFTDGTAEDRARAFELALPYASPARRKVFRVARLCPQAFAFVNRRRRRRLDRQREGARG